MKRTKKRLAAQQKATLFHSDPRCLDNDSLYKLLETNGYIWDHKQGQWVEGSTSIFADAQGEPTGILKIRVMGHPDDVKEWLNTLPILTSQYLMIEVSDNYLNRGGAGIRVYTTWKETD